MKQSVMFRVEDTAGNVVYAEVRNYKIRTYAQYASRRMTQLLGRYEVGYTVYAQYFDEPQDAGVWLNTQ